MFILNVLFSVCFVGCTQTGKHFCSRQQADGMPPPGRQLAERCQHKLAFVHPWMRQDDSGGVDNLIAGIYDVDIKLTVGITAVGIAVAGASRLALDALEDVEQTPDGQVALKLDSDIEKGVIRLITPCFRFVYA